MTKNSHCENCGTELSVVHIGRPRRYCSAACRQAAHRLRMLSPASEHAAMSALAVRLRDNADQLWLIIQGWTPPSDQGGAALDALLADTIAVAEEMSAGARHPRNETRNDSPSRPPIR